MLVEELEEVALEVQVEVLAEVLDQAEQVDQGEEVLAAVVVVADQGEVEETLQETPTEAESMVVKAMMMTLRMI